VLRLPLSAIVLAALLTANSGAGSLPLVIVGVVVAYVITTVLSRPPTGEAADDDDTPQPIARPSVSQEV
jgi:hypothetical protein